MKTSLKRRALAAVYAEVQNRPALKRLAVRLMMRFPALGARAMAAVAPAARAPVRRGGTVDAQARAVYLEQGYRPLLLGEAPAAANAAPRRRLLVDMSGLVERDARTGIQRVVRNLTRALAMLELPGWRVEPVYEAAGVFRYARRFVAADWQLPELGLDDEVIEAGPGDVFFTADLALLPIAAMHQPLRDLRARGVAVHFVLHDLIPVSHPQFYQGEIDPRFMRWLDIMLDVADGIWCVSSAVADELRAWLQAHPQKAPRGMPRIGWFHLGAELPRPAGPAARHAASTLPLAAAGPDSVTLLMVGTLEPRKGHLQVLEACELLWASGEDVNLLIIGKLGWNVRELAERLRAHPQAGQRLCWLDDADDTMLAAAYAGSSALVAASYAEGFGLPLIEAAQQGLPIIARDIPVFREVAGEHAWYFEAAQPSQLAAALRTWIALRREAGVPDSAGLPFQRWEQSARRVAELILPARREPPADEME